MRKLLSIITALMLVFSLTVSADYTAAGSIAANTRVRLAGNEDVSLITAEAVFAMTESGILKALEEKGELSAMSDLKTKADEALNLAAYADTEKTRTAALNLCTELERAVAILKGTQSSVGFADVNADAWYYNAVSYTVKQGIFKGMDEMHFAPDTAITRGMFLALMGRMYLDTSVKTVNAYADVRSDMYYAAAVNTAKAKGILSFIEGDKFCPDQAITREELVTVLRGCMAQSGANTDFTANAAFADGGQISEWATASVSWAAEKKVVAGFEDNTFRPQATATRAQVAQIFYSLKG
ncbi:MAG: S-layer homology domain-containing protein [Clostridia bacterium]|nr:S-layer homology domain-containing protein [Clostridia bacterium]